MKKIKDDVGAQFIAPSEGVINHAPTETVFITDDPSEIQKFHAAGIKEIAVRDGREYVFKIIRPPTEDGGPTGGQPSAVSGLDQREKENAENR